MKTRLATMLLAGISVLPAAAQTYQPFETTGAPVIRVPVVRAAKNVQTAPSVPSLGREGLMREGTAPEYAPAAPQPPAVPVQSPDPVSPRPPSTPSSDAPQKASEAVQTRFSAGQALSGRAKVHDGHSLVLASSAVRLDGVEAPGLAQTCSTRAGTAWRCGKAAFDRLAELVAGRTVRCVVASPAGGGAAASCSVAGVPDIAALLVSEGMAVPNTFGRARYAALAADAASRRKGLWSGGFEDPAKWRAGPAPTRR